jgi:hypothetical protein
MIFSLILWLIGLVVLWRLLVICWWLALYLAIQPIQLALWVLSPSSDQ